MAVVSAKTVALDFLTHLEEDIPKIGKNLTPSKYSFAGRLNGVDVGLSNTSNIIGNRAGQIYQFLAGFYSATGSSAPTTAEKTRIATAAGLIYKALLPRLIMQASPDFSIPTKKPIPPGDPITNGHWAWTDPSGALFLLGLMMLDKQGVVADPNFLSSASSTDYPVDVNRVKGQIGRHASKIQIGLQVTEGSTQALKRPSTNWHNQKLAEVSVNGHAINLAVYAVYLKLYTNEDEGNKHWEDAQTILRRVAVDFGTTYDANGTTVSVTTPGASPGTKLSLAIGGQNSSRGPFPSVGYNGIVAMSLELMAFAEKALNHHTFSDMLSLTSTHVLHTDALKILNYYRDRISHDGHAYELGAHNNMGYSAQRMRDARLATAGVSADDFGKSGGFDMLVRQDNQTLYPGQGAYAYSMMWSMPTHSVFTKLSEAYATSKSHESWEVNWSKVGTSASTMQALSVAESAVKSSEANTCRAISGLGYALINGVSTIQ